MQFLKIISRDNSKQITIFSGEYLNGERKQGKEYNYNGYIVYEGEYLNGKRHGKGKVYDDNDRLKYEGEYLNGKKHGRGIEYYTYPRRKYEGEFINGKKCGKGKEYIYNYNSRFLDDSKNSTLIFDGEFFNNSRIRGKEYHENGK